MFLTLMKVGPDDAAQFNYAEGSSTDLALLSLSILTFLWTLEAVQTRTTCTNEGRAIESPGI